MSVGGKRCPTVESELLLLALVFVAVRVKGLFRIGGLKSRIKRLRQDFDGGAKVELNSEHSPHDVASLLKEYLRELPQCLLTRDLYHAFLATVYLKGSDEDRLMSLRLLVSLLPVANRDTLWWILSLLKIVAENSSDQVTWNGSQLPGNCMDSSNLATVFGPTLLHKFKPGKSQQHPDQHTDQLNQHQDVAAIIKAMIDSHETIFKLPKDVHREILESLMDSDPEAADYILCHRISADSDQQFLDTTDSQENSFLTNSSTGVASVDASPRMGPDGAAAVGQRQRRYPASTARLPPTHQQPNGSAVESHSFNQLHSGVVCRLPNNTLPECSVANDSLSDAHQVALFLGVPESTSSPSLNSRPHVNLSDYDFYAHSKPHLVQDTQQRQSKQSPLRMLPGAGNRPLPSNQPSLPGHYQEALPGSWEMQRWKYWEYLARKCSEDQQEEQTLV